MSRFLDARGIATHLAIDGPPGAPAILLLHSLGSSLRIWDDQAEALARGLRVVRYDLRGHGLTEVGGVATHLMPEAHRDNDHPERLVSAGQPIPGVELSSFPVEPLLRKSMVV